MDDAVQEIKQIDTGWLWSIQLPERPECFQVGIAHSELEAHREARDAIKAWRSSPLYELAMKLRG